jgi:hypothetical protein
MNVLRHIRQSIVDNPLIWITFSPFILAYLLAMAFVIGSIVVVCKELL